MDHLAPQDHSDQREVLEGRESTEKEGTAATRDTKVGRDPRDFQDLQECRVTAEMPGRPDQRDFEATEVKADPEVAPDPRVQTGVPVFPELRDPLGHLVTTVDRVLPGHPGRQVLPAQRTAVAMVPPGTDSLLGVSSRGPRDLTRCMAMIQISKPNRTLILCKSVKQLID